MKADSLVREDLSVLWGFWKPQNSSPSLVPLLAAAASMSGFDLVADGLYRRDICLSLLKDHVPTSCLWGIYIMKVKIW